MWHRVQNICFSKGTPFLWTKMGVQASRLAFPMSNRQNRRCLETLLACVAIDLTISLFQSHSFIHTNPSKYQCTICKRNFGTASAFYSHKRNSHKDATYPCPECKKVRKNTLWLCVTCVVDVSCRHVHFSLWRNSLVVFLAEFPVALQAEWTSRSSSQRNISQVWESHCNSARKRQRYDACSCPVQNEFSVLILLNNSTWNFFANRFTCSVCGEKFQGEYNFGKHMKDKHGEAYVSFTRTLFWAERGCKPWRRLMAPCTCRFCRHGNPPG